MARVTIANPIEVHGTGLHTGAVTSVRLSQGRVGEGIIFRRVDLPDSPSIRARTSHVNATERRTSLSENGVSVETVEHLLAAAQALGVDDLMIEIDGPEPPILDGSFYPWVVALEEAGFTERPGDAAVVKVTTPFTVREGESTYLVAPYNGLQLTTTIEWEHPVIGRQSASFQITPESFRREIARARTFGFMHEVAALRGKGLLQGATADMAVVLSDDGVATGELRWPDEFVRHKIGDIVGDLALLGARVEAQIVAERPSHQGNLALTQALARRASRIDPGRVDVTRIMQAIPHRFPFLLVDRVIEIEPEVRLVAIKNVTINEPFFQGHFPGYPIMPGVLIVEAMAQAGGLLLMDRFEDPASKVVLFMAIDNAKFRKPVVPGDQLRFELALLQVLRGSICRMRGEAYVDGTLVCEAEMMAKVIDK